MKRRHVARTIDWTVVRQRLAMADAALQQGFAPDPGKRREILRARAAELARVPLPETAPEDCVEILEFSLAQECYALELRFVEEVYLLKDLTPLPCTPDFVLGIVAARGRILSVVDLKRLFGLPHAGLTDLNKIMVLRDPGAPDGMEFGVLADRILGVRVLPVADIQAPLPMLNGIRADYLKGVTGERLALLDAKKLLEDKSIVVEQESM